jgi:UDP-glucose 4-epimerase
MGFWQGKKALVTGGAGFIPSHLVDHLLVNGAEVTAMDNLKDGKLENLAKARNSPSFTFREADLRNKNGLKELVENQDFIFHLGGNANVPYSVEHPDYDFHTNVIGTYNILKCCLDCGVKRVIYASTAAVYGEPEYTPINEKHPLNPISPYGASKLAGEHLGFAYKATYGLDFIGVRIFNTYGPRQPRYVMYDFIKKLKTNPKRLEVLGTGEQVRDYCHVSDTVKAFLLVAKKGKDVYNVAGGNPISIKELAEFMGKKIAPEVEIVYTGKSWKGDINTLVADISKLRNLGFEPKVSLWEGIGSMVKWFDKNL